MVMVTLPASSWMTRRSTLGGRPVFEDLSVLKSVFCSKCRLHLFTGWQKRPKRCHIGPRHTAGQKSVGFATASVFQWWVGRQGHLKEDLRCLGGSADRKHEISLRAQLICIKDDQTWKPDEQKKKTWQTLANTCIMLVLCCSVVKAGARVTIAKTLLIKEPLCVCVCGTSEQM